ncbi:HDOD domain-containing protein [Fundidesulfovibrio soli]|uniref:HDOD domain-containing protein n=1 Tax=Fundidesulfovibrio soli TaxID=2922716 RepID=UPI001FAF8482|nr:HDOD domain-containing protein [Fundidesulfovibrio soli]
MTLRDQIISRMEQLPQMPAPVMRIMAYLSKPDADLGELATAIEYDPGLTVNVLRMANSSFFGGAGGITTVRDALFRLGTRRVVQLVIASGVAPRTQPAVAGYKLNEGELLRHSIAVGTGAEVLARELGLRAPDYTFTAGLLCTIGKIVLGKFLEVDADQLLALSYNENIPFEEAERRLLGIDHAELGAMMLRRWELPAPIVNCVRWYLDPAAAPAEERDDALDLIHVGHVMATMAGIGQGLEGMRSTVCQECFDRLKLTQDAMIASMAQVVNALAEIEVILSRTGA